MKKVLINNGFDIDNFLISIISAFIVGFISYFLKLLLVFNANNITDEHILVYLIAIFNLFLVFGYCNYKYTKGIQLARVAISFLYFIMTFLGLYVLYNFLVGNTYPMGLGIYGLSFDFMVSLYSTLIGVTLYLFIHKICKEKKINPLNLIVSYWMSVFSVFGSYILLKLEVVYGLFLNPLVILFGFDSLLQILILAPVTFLYYLLFIKAFNFSKNKIKSENNFVSKLLWSIPIVMIFVCHIALSIFGIFVLMLGIS